MYDGYYDTLTLPRLNRDLRKTYGWDDSTFLLRGEGPVDDLAGDAIDGRADDDGAEPAGQRENDPRDAGQRRGGENDAGQRRGGENAAGQRREGANDNAGGPQDRPKKKKKAPRKNVRLHR